MYQNIVKYSEDIFAESMLGEKHGNLITQRNQFILCLTPVL